MKITPFETRESIVFENEGMKLFGMLQTPLYVKKPPIVLLMHGFAGHKVGKHRMYVVLSELLTRAGIAVFRFDFRGSGDSEGEFINMTISSEVSDAQKALQWLEKDGRFDMDRLGIMGRSLGGLVAVIAASEYKKVKSVALWAPAFHADQWAEQWSTVQDPDTPDHVIAQLMQFDGIHANEFFLREFFALKLGEHLDKLSEVPLLHIHGEKDFAVDLSHARQYEIYREKAAAETQILRLPNTGHDFAHLEEQKQTIDSTLDWFKRTL